MVFWIHLSFWPFYYLLTVILLSSVRAFGQISEIFGTYIEPEYPNLPCQKKLCVLQTTINLPCAKGERWMDGWVDCSVFSSSSSSYTFFPFPFFCLNSHSFSLPCRLLGPDISDIGQVDRPNTKVVVANSVGSWMNSPHRCLTGER